MTQKQPEALRLAEALDQHYSYNTLLPMDAADELRRLHEVNVELLEALKAMVKMVARTPMVELQEVEQACAAIAKAEAV